MSASEEYFGQNALISYLQKTKKQSYYGFLKYHRDIIIASITTTTDLKDLDNFWIMHFLREGQDLPDLYNKLNLERSRCAKKIQIFWQEVIKEYKENVVPTVTVKIPAIKNTSNTITNFCYSILHELENKSNINPFYRCTNKPNNPMDLFTICSKLDNEKYTNINEFEKDMHLIFRNCYTYNDKDSKIYHLGEELELVFIEMWAEKTQKEELKRMQNSNDIDSSAKVLTEKNEKNEKNINLQKVELKRVQDNGVDLSTDHMAKQFQILEQNKTDLVFKNVVNDAFHATLAYKNLVTGNIIPFIKNLKLSLLSRSQMSLFSADEPVLQAIVEGLLPRKYRIPELSLVMDGKKPKGSGRFGYSDIFIIKGTGDNNISLELKYVSLVGLIKKQKNEYGANDLEDLDKTLEKEDEKLLLSRPYSFWSKEHNKLNQTTISEILENGINQLRSYMIVIAKGKPTDYSSSGIIDKRIKITKSNPNKLKGFVILVIGFRRILWRPVKEVISNYSYYKV
ncbi:hypothetical protein RclHR1_08360002 [Rhizophagus clarus]|uniref:Bromo domain-containing protein n=1 Tax=Rhizophagus clarus TaxID=94130 RepID=A0A2Z6S0P9_9GLOM|nr:hypothetical protein RclHR1_08360002 [Rhizophagus clarus]GET01469.1 hypothetical protein GLOIN_2v1781474 [Rhizophagus clarus]